MSQVLVLIVCIIKKSSFLSLFIDQSLLGFLLVSSFCPKRLIAIKRCGLKTELMQIKNVFQINKPKFETDKQFVKTHKN